MSKISEFLISVIIPIFNGDKYLKDCLNNLKKQSFKKNFEIILVNDASTDSFENIIKNFQIDNLRVFTFEKNKGQSAARNFGIKKSLGKYVFFLDVDDKISENSLDTLFQATKENDYDYIFTDFERVENLKNQRVDRYNYSSDKIFLKADIIEGMARELYDPTLGHLGLFGCNGRLIKRQILLDNNVIFDEKIRWLEDKTFAWDVLKHVNKAKYIRKQLYSYYVNPNVKSAIVDSLSRSNSIELIETILKHIKISLEFIGLSEEKIKKLTNQGLIFFSIQILVSISRSISLSKIQINEGIKIRKKIINEIINNFDVNKAVKFYKRSSEESILIPLAIRIRSAFLLEMACNFRAKKVIKKRRLGKD